MRPQGTEARRFRLEIGVRRVLIQADLEKVLQW